MSQILIQDIDFKSTANMVNIRGALYTGVGSPVGVISSPNTGALYIDQAGNQLWQCITASSTATGSWIPFGSIVTNNIRIDTNVQEGDLVGVFGAGTWATSGNLNTTRSAPSVAGYQSAALIFGGGNAAGTLAQASSELFNGSAWTSSGNLNLSRFQASGCGSQAAALVSGGVNAVPTILGSSELFNGSAWTSSGNLNVTRKLHNGLGTQNASWVAGGFNGSNVSISNLELFNGSIWSLQGNQNITRTGAVGTGTVYAGLSTSGSVDGSTGFSSTELFNGSSWMSSAFINAARFYSAGGGTQVSSIIAGGRITGSLDITSSELFNGSVWSFSGPSSVSRQFQGGTGSQNGTVVAGGQAPFSITNIETLLTEIHTQSIYRKLSYTDYASAGNIGIAYNTSNSSLTASVMTAVLPSTVVPPYYKLDPSFTNSLTNSAVFNNQFFGISKYNNDQGIAYLDTSINCTSLTSSSAGQAQLNLSGTLNWFFTGMLLSITNTGSGIPTGIYPVVGGSVTAPVVRWEGASSGSITATVAPAWGHRITNLTATSIVSSTLNGSAALQFTINSNTGLTTGQLDRLVRINDILVVPYSPTINSGATTSTGSYWNYGAYQIQAISGNVITCYQVRPLVGNELNIGNISILQHIVTNPVSLDLDAILMGLNGRMNVITNPAWSDSANGMV